jgi:twitching motility protein PilI
MDDAAPDHHDPITIPASAGGERRSRLRQYQVQLLERMQAAKSGAAIGVRELGVVIGGHHCLLDLTQIGEIVTPQPVAPVPLARDWYLGLANIRGDLTGVIDLARYQGHAAGGTATPTERRLITFSPKLGFNCALLADRVLGLRKSSEMSGVDRPASAQPMPAWADHQFDDAHGQRWTMLDLAQLVREPRFLLAGY